jgi:cobalt/nickel transport system permease protein
MQPDRLEHESFERRGAAAALLARCSPRAKLIAALALLVAVCVAQPAWFSIASGVPLSWIHVAAAAIVAVAVWAARMSPRYLARRLAAFAMPISIVGLSIPLANGPRGWPIMAGVLTKGFLSFAIVLLLVHSTGFDKLLGALRSIGLPKLLVAVLAATYRYVFVLLEELERMRRAQFARTFDCPHRLSRITVANGTRLIGMLLLRSSERAERVHAAMVARGFDGEVRVLDDTP